MDEFIKKAIKEAGVKRGRFQGQAERSYGTMIRRQMAQNPHIAGWDVNRERVARIVAGQARAQEERHEKFLESFGLPDNG